VTTIWTIWKARNYCVFNQKVSKADFVIHSIKLLGGLKRNARILIVILKYDTPINLFWGYLMCSLLAP
jgi:hypothetical protein